MKSITTSAVMLALAAASLPSGAQASPLEFGAQASPVGKWLANTFDKSNQCSEGHAYVAKGVMKSALERTRIEPEDTIASFCAAVRQEAGTLRASCFDTCEADFAAAFDSRKQGQQEAERERIAQAERARTAELEKQQAIAQRHADLKSGRVKPDNLEEAAIVHGARPGDGIVSSPKLRPDGALYYLHGRIKHADARPVFFAVPTMSQVDQMNLAVYNLRGIGRQLNVPESTDYFKVLVPKALQEAYFANARIEGGFDLVGRYSAITTYRNALGQEKTGPVFEVVYFKPW
ncbi:hypothetical protein G4G28_16615 [Massilia sp. Dwa41.01b]|uniref:hypothetical protein n=1 Tax=unclassified Massilia TaxID=2609279 RepID=UPI0016023367|nr:MULTISPECIES: hypothetical protein [unclassified Massilia]QNA89688.1 hypothetical protein G4G28_16615 [Massilia sp. Dwa41.01b]QNB00583.1 hypothetical protein G4G31_20200 [Massilia sp. Se16.2.3]